MCGDSFSPFPSMIRPFCCFIYIHKIPHNYGEKASVLISTYRRLGEKKNPRLRVSSKKEKNIPIFLDYCAAFSKLNFV